MTQPNPKADSQSPAEGLRQQILAYVGYGTDDVRFADEMMASVTAYAATVEREALERLKGWIDRNHYQPVNESDRWVQASGEIMQEIDNRLAALQGPQDGDD